MGNGTELWDDSALINAFDHAMATYKEMHSNGSHGNSGKEEKHASDRKEQDLVLVEKAAGHVEPVDNNNNISGNTSDTYVIYDNTEVATEDPSNQGNNFGTDVHAPESDQCSSGFPFTDGKSHCYSDQQSMDYSKLLKQYYELEDQKQKVVQQLHEANYWNHDTLVQNPTCELPRLSGYTVSEHGPQTSCSLCSCHCIAFPLIPTACAICGPSTGGYSCPSHMACCTSSLAHEVPGNFPADNCQHSSATVTLSAVDPVNCSKADDNAVKVGALAVEGAINSMTVALSAISNDGEDTLKLPKKRKVGVADVLRLGLAKMSSYPYVSLSALSPVRFVYRRRRSFPGGRLGQDKAFSSVGRDSVRSVISISIVGPLSVGA